jgi:hypothetical protein
MEGVSVVHTALPVVDLGDEPAVLREWLRSVAHEVGFFHLVGPGMPYYFNPRLDARLPVLTLPDDLAAKANGITTDPSNDRIYALYGRNAWKSRLRAHPDVAAHQYAQA